MSRTPDATITGLTLTGVNTLRIGGNRDLLLDNFALGDTAADVGAIPEPASVGLFGLASLLALSRRRSR